MKNLEEENESMKKTIDALTKENKELSIWKQAHSSEKQSFMRMATRLRKLCKKLTPSTEIVAEMQQLASDIKNLAREATK